MRGVRTHKFSLTHDNFRDDTAKIEKALRLFKLSEHEVMNGLLMLEELFTRCRNAQKDFQCTVEIKKRFGNIRLLMISEGAEYNPLEYLEEYDSEDANYYNVLILKSRKNQLGYTRKNSANVISIALLPAERNRLKMTLAAMVLGIICGLLLKNFAPDYIVSFLDKNIVYSIRTMFLNALNMMIAPVVFFSIVAGLTSMANASDISRIGGKLLFMYICTTLIATVFSMSVSMIIFHSGLPQVGTVGAAGEAVRISLIDMIVGIVPKDLVTPIVKRDMLQINFMAFLFGTTINILGEKVAVLSRFADVLNTLNLRIIAMIARFIPIVAFLSMMSLIFSLGITSIYLLGRVLLGQLTGAVLMIAVYCVMISIVGKISPMPFLRKIVGFLPVPASMGSSTATMPFTMKFCTDKMGAAQSLSSFSIPLGATVNMDGGCFYFAIFTIMAAKMYGIAITPSFLLSLFIAIIALSIGAPGVPGGAFVCLTSIMVSFGMPIEAAAFALGSESLVSIFRMTINIIGDIAATTALASNEKLLDSKVYNS